jgi:alkylhydroperoxidase family enzyme
VTRIYRHTIADAPETSRPLLEGYVPFSPTGKLLNVHAQMAHSPLVLAAYAAVRQAAVTRGTLDPKVRSALMLVTTAAGHSAYAEALTSFLAIRSGWSPSEVRSLRDGHLVGDDKTDSLVGVIREAAARAGRVSDAAWQRAVDRGWSSEQLTEAFGYLALAVFTAYFVNYAQTPIDLPEDPATAAEAAAGLAAGLAAPVGPRE